MTGDVSDAWSQEPWHVTVPPGYPNPAPQVHERIWQPRRDLVVAAVVAVAVGVLGSVVGLLWAAWAPHLSLHRLVGSEGPFTWQFGIDTRFLVLAMLAGGVSAVAVYVLGGRGPGAILGLAGGGAAGAAVAARVGFLAERAHTLSVMRFARVPSVYLDVLEFKLRAVSVAAAWPIVAVGVFMTIVAIRDDIRSLP